MYERDCNQQETVVTKQGICQKYVVPKQPPNSPEDEVPSGIICNAMDILYVLEMSLAFYAWYK